MEIKFLNIFRMKSQYSQNVFIWKRAEIIMICILGLTDLQMFSEISEMFARKKCMLD